MKIEGHFEQLPTSKRTQCQPKSIALGAVSMKWSRFVYCAAVAALTTFLVICGISLWITVPLAVFGAYWTVLCTHALWRVASFRVAGWRLHLTPSFSAIDLTERRKVKPWQWLSHPRLDGLVNAGTIVCVLGFPTLLWLPLIFLLLST
ncbi:hypothetical protein [Bradyrhizobium sp. SSUT77]|uniref:hypothetical protein n=1 Tax=Bradyrhizobium sp. SSUT77 TaxID=3040603 RepID=UPI0024492F87|nr:hypothetical protein [Bradyrhizobium sp. SSUT77]MDH2341526.1 hypothetical protein [Bradyrhizobium sp. SSUT77]